MSYRSEEEIARALLGASTQLALHDWQWRVMGFDGCPKRGSLFNRFVARERLAREAFLIRELAIVGISEGQRIVREEVSGEAARRVGAWIVWAWDNAEGIAASFRFERGSDFLGYFVQGLNAYATADAEVRLTVFLKRARGSLEDTCPASWLIGGARLFSEPGAPLLALSTHFRESLPDGPAVPLSVPADLLKLLA